MRKKIALLVFLAALSLTMVLTCRTPGIDPLTLIPPADEYDVRILRDTWGVPHIFGKTDADCSYGLAYAHAEDDFPTIQDALLAVRGKVASKQGKEGAPFDFMFQLMRVRDLLDQKYATDLSPEVRALCEAYADGINHYAARHPEEVMGEILPVTGKDIVAGFVFKAPFFYGLDGPMKELMGDKRTHEVSEKKIASVDAFLSDGLPVGSNAFAVSPKRSANGETFLNINSHQPWEGPVAWYEAHLHSETGLDIVGGTFPGVPIILVGHNRHLGWAHTVNQADLVDIYVLDINPDNPNQYKFDGAWRDLDVREVPITVKLWGPVHWTVKREVLWSVYGPTVRQPHGVYAIRYAGMGDIRQVEQWYRMGKATNLAEWQDAMRMNAIASFNCVYADDKGNIDYIFNARLPIRNPDYDWKQYLPGNTSETLWTEYLPFDRLPQALNPASGFVISCNNSPFKTTEDPYNPNPREYPATFGIDTRMTNRALRALELFSADTSITEEEFFAYKYDMHYSEQGAVAKAVHSLVEGPAPDDPLSREAIEVLRGWDLNTNPENTAAAIGVLSIGPNPDGGAAGSKREAMLKLLENNARDLKSTHGRIDVPWGEVNRLHRGDLNIPIGGAPDVLHAVYGFRVREGKLEGFEKGQVYGRAGDSYVLLATWDKDGKLHSRSIHQFGAATMRPKSPHYADQAPLFAARQTKEVWMDEAGIRAHLEREYRPGE